MNRRVILACAVLAGSFMSEFGFALLFLPLIQHYLPVNRQLSLAVPGYALSAYGAARLIGQVPLGAIADAVDDRLIFATGYLVVLLAGLVFWLPVPVFVLLLAAVAFGAGHALADPLIPPALIAHAESGTHGRALSLLSLTQLAGLGAGVGVGAFIVDLAPPAAGFVVDAVANGLALCFLTASGVRGVLRPEGETLMTAIKGWHAALTARPVLWMFGVFFALGLATNELSPDLTPFIVRQLHSSLHIMVLYMVPTGLAGVGALWAGGWIADRIGRFPPLLAGAALAAVAFAVLTQVRQPWEGAVVGVFIAAGLAMTMPTSTAALLDEVGRRHSGLVIGGMMSVQGLAQAIGPLLGGVAIAAGGPQLPMGIAAAGCGLAVPLIVLYAGCRRDGGRAVAGYHQFARFFDRWRRPGAAVTLPKIVRRKTEPDPSNPERPEP